VPDDIYRFSRASEHLEELARQPREMSMSDGDVPKVVRDLKSIVCSKPQTLTDNVVEVAASQERAEPDAFQQVLFIKCLWEMLGDYLIEHQGWTKLELIGVLIGEE
jgi:hypothetical protein